MKNQRHTHGKETQAVVWIERARGISVHKNKEAAMEGFFSSLEFFPLHLLHYLLTLTPVVTLKPIFHLNQFHRWHLYSSMSTRSSSYFVAKSKNQAGQKSISQWRAVYRFKLSPLLHTWVFSLKPWPKSTWFRKSAFKNHPLGMDTKTSAHLYWKNKTTLTL